MLFSEKLLKNFIYDIIIPMKKRVFVSLIATIVCIALTNKFWLLYEPVNLSFIMKGSGNYKVTAVFNKHDNNDFVSCKYAEGEFNLNESNKISLDVKRGKKLKRLKIAINSDKMPGGGGQTLSMSGFLLFGHKITDLQNFSANNADIKIQNNSLIVSSFSPYFELIYNTPFNIKAKPFLDYKFLIIIAVLSFLLAYQLASYLADFKNIKNQSRIEIIFLTIFGFILIIPTSNINNEKYSEQENRKLAEKPQFIVDNEINYNFGKEFDTWFSDRFNQRSKIIKDYNKLRFALTYNLYNQNGTYYNKHTKWTFFLNRSSENLYSQFPVYYKNIKKLNDFCEQNDIKLYIMLIPIKEEIYPPSPKYKKKYDNIINLKNYVNKKIDKELIQCPIKELKEASKKDYTFLKGDSHWSEYGAFIAYKELMNSIKKDFPDIKIAGENDFVITRSKLGVSDYPQDAHIGGQYKSLYIGDEYLDVEYLSYESRPENNVKLISYPNAATDSYFPNGNNKKVYLIGNSFTGNMSLFLNNTFKEVKRRRINNSIETPKCRMSRWENEILEYKPDLLIFLIAAPDYTIKEYFSELYEEDE